MVLVHDGLEYISFAKMDNTIDYLISEEKIEPTIAVFVPPVDRTPEYVDAKQDAFTNFIIDEVNLLHLWFRDIPFQLRKPHWSWRR